MEKGRRKVGKQVEKNDEEIWLIAFGDAISDRREWLNMTQQELADEADVHRTYLSDIERGRRNVTVTTLKRIATALRLKTSELIKKADERFNSSSFLRKINRT